MRGSGNEIEILTLIPSEMGSPGGILSMILFTF